VLALAFSLNGKYLASAGFDKTVKVWDATTGQELLMLKGQTTVGWSLAFSPNGKQLAFASGEGIVKIWDLATGQEVRTFKSLFHKALAPRGRGGAGPPPPPPPPLPPEATAHGTDSELDFCNDT
jgi:WD40 repeat protein